MTPLDHAKSTVAKFGGTVDDYLHIHNWFDETKQYTGDWTHRALRHHSAGIEWCIDKFGHYVTTSESINNDIIVPVKVIAEQHVTEDCGFIPTPADWLRCIKPPHWMLKVGKIITKDMELE